MTRASVRPQRLFAAISAIAFATSSIIAGPFSPTQALTLRIDAKPGELATIGDLAVVVLGWQDIKPGQFSKPDEGNKFVGVEAIVVNISDEPTSVSAYGAAELKDDESQKYDVSISAGTAMTAPQLSGVLLPGERLRGWLAFEVPTAVKSLELQFKPSMFADEELSVPLAAKPGLTAAPKTIKGEVAPKTAAIGAPLKIGDYTVTVNKISVVKAGIMKPDPGNRFLVVDMLIENNSGDKSAFSTVLQTAIKDADGYRYGVDLGATTAAKAKTPDGDLKAGEKVKGQVGYEVPVAAKGLMFEFVGGLLDKDKLLIAIPEMK
jgi:hypothetical protein